MSKSMCSSGCYYYCHKSFEEDDMIDVCGYYECTGCVEDPPQGKNKRCPFLTWVCPRCLKVYKPTPKQIKNFNLFKGKEGINETALKHCRKCSIETAIVITSESR